MSKVPVTVEKVALYHKAGDFSDPYDCSSLGIKFTLSKPGCKMGFGEIAKLSDGFEAHGLAELLRCFADTVSDCEKKVRYARKVKDE